MMHDSRLQMRVVHQLMYAAGNVDHADSQRQAAISLEVLPGLEGCTAT